MKVEISSTQAARQFGDCLARVKYRGDSFVITRNNERVAELIPSGAGSGAKWSEIYDALAGLPADPGFAEDLEKVNQMAATARYLEAAVLIGPDDEKHFRRVEKLGVRVIHANRN